MCLSQEFIETWKTGPPGLWGRERPGGFMVLLVLLSGWVGGERTRGGVPGGDYPIPPSPGGSRIRGVAGPRTVFFAAWVMDRPRLRPQFASLVSRAVGRFTHQ